MTSVILAALAAWLLMAHPAAAQTTTIFSDDFSSGTLSNWTNPGNCTISGGALQVAKSTDIIRAVSGTASWTDYKFTCNATITASAIGIVFRSPDNNSGYMFQLNVASAAARYHIKSGGTWTYVSPLSYPFVTGSSYAVEIDVSGANFSLYINGSLLGTITDSTWPTGVIGYRTGQSETASITNVAVTQGPLAPKISSPTAASSVVNTAFSYQITAYNSPVAFGAAGLPAGLVCNASTGLISGTPTATGTYGVGLTAGNAVGTGSATLALTILPPMPVITSTSAATGTNGYGFSYQITATNGPTSFGASGLPAGLAVNASSGLISGTPSVSGSFAAAVSATYLSQTGTAPLAITLVSVPPGVPVAFQGLGRWNNGTPYAALQWTSGVGSIPTAYLLERRLSGVGSYQQLTSLHGSALNSFNDYWVSPGSSYDYRLTASNTSGTASPVTATFTVPQPVPLGYPAWAQSLPGSGGWTDTDTSGVTNALRYAFAGNPALGGAAGGLLLQVTGSNALTLWGRTFAARRDTHYRLQGSSDLAGWQSYLDETGAAFAPVGAGPGSTAALLSVNAAAPSAPKFFRWSVSPNASAAVAPAGLLVNGLAGASGALLTQKHPAFSWEVGNDSQTGYEIIVATSPGALASGTGLLWDSGQVSGSNGLGIVLPASVTLQNGTTYYWTVRTWDSAGVVSTYAPSQTFTTGTLTSAYATDTPRLIKVPVAPVSVVQKGPGWYFIDFGRDAFANLSVTIPNPVAGQTVTLGLGEMLTNPVTINTAPPATIRYQADSFTMVGGSTNYTVIPTHSGGYAQPAYTGQVTPFRYVEITGVPDPFTASQITQYAVHVPFDDTAAAFNCSDALINQIWALCKYTTYATTFPGVFVDGDRERTPYESDDYIHGLNCFCVDRDYATSQFSLEYFYVSSHTTWPTEWWSTIPMFAWKDYLYTGDPRSMLANYAALQPKLLSAGVRGDGLYVTGSVSGLTDIVDWPAGERDGYDMTPVIKTVVSSFQTESEICMQQIASSLYTLTGSAGFLTDANKAAAISGSATTALNTYLWSSTNGRYLDAMSAANVTDSHSAIHANMIPYAMGLVPLNRQAGTIAYVKSRGLVCGVYGAQYLFEALYLAGEGTYAQSLLDSTGLRSWYNMIQEGTTMTAEAWDETLKTNEDWNHAWGSAACNIIARFLMGVRPLQPGFAKFLIQPQPGTLSYANFTMPTVCGPVTVNVQANTATEFSMSVLVPANTSALVSVPALSSTSTTVYMDGQPVTGTGPGGTITPNWAFTEKPAMVSSTGLVTGSTIFIDNVPPGPHLFERVP